MLNLVGPCEATLSKLLCPGQRRNAVCLIGLMLKSRNVSPFLDRAASLGQANQGLWP